MCVGGEGEGGVRAQFFSGLCAIVLLMRNEIFDEGGIVVSDTFVDRCGS